MVIGRQTLGGNSHHNQIETSMSGNKRMREISVLNSPFVSQQNKRMKVSPAEVLDCSGHDGVRAEARTGKGMGRWMDTRMMRMTGLGTGMGTWAGAGAGTGTGRGRR